MNITGKIFKQFKGSLDAFKYWLGVDDNAALIGDAIVFIHEMPESEDDVVVEDNEFVGWIYANGFYYRSCDCDGEGFELTAQKIKDLVNGEESNVEVSVVADAEGKEKLVFTAADAASTEKVIAGAKVGYVNASDEIPAGTTIQDLIEMIFTKVLGLRSAKAPSNTLKLSVTTDREVGEVISSITATAAYNDGYWINEKNAEGVDWGDGKQYYDCTVKEYTFTDFAGEDSVETVNTLTVKDHVVVEGANTMSVVTSYNDCANVPVKSNGEPLTEGDTNDSKNYKAQGAGACTKASASFNGKYKWFIGTLYTAAEGGDDIRNLQYKGFLGTQPTCSFNNDGGTSSSVKVGQILYVAVPKGHALVSCTTLLGAQALAYFDGPYSDKTGISLDGSTYDVYEFAPNGADTVMENFVIE